MKTTLPTADELLDLKSTLAPPRTLCAIAEETLRLKDCGAEISSTFEDAERRDEAELFSELIKFVMKWDTTLNIGTLKIKTSEPQ